MKKYLTPLSVFIFHISGYSQNLIQYVKPLVGTAKMGHTYPGATVPFGSVQLSPDTDTIPFSLDGKYNNDVYKYCAGYQYDDPTIVGFSHTHFSGTGHSDLGDFLIMPTIGKLQLNPGTKDHPENGYRSRFSHNNETAEPNYYKVKLDDDNILAELTTTTRVGFHQYTFPKSDSAHIILDMVHGIYNYPGKTVYTYLRIINDSTVTGYRQTNGWARNRTVYFAMVFSKQFFRYGNENSLKSQSYRGFWRFNQSRDFPEIAAQQVRAYFDFKTNEGEKLRIKFSISPVSMLNAIANLKTEIPGWNFDEVKRKGQQQWERELERIKIQSTDLEVKQNFYTAMYHAAIMPTVYMDINEEYKGVDQNVHKANNFTNYTSFSLWDTYRAFHPYMNIVSPSRNADMVSSMLAHYDQSPEHMLPIWSHYANENWCMSGYHSVSVISDAIIKGTYKGDPVHALNACIATATNRSYDALGYYMDMGYIPAEKNGVSVSSTLEYAYDDWCIAQLAKKLNRMNVYDSFIKRSANWKNVYDASIGYMRPKLSDGTFRSAFDVLKTDGQGFIEGNAWNYSLYVPQDPAGMIAMMGGKERFAAHLDSLFTMHLPDEFFAETEDITREGIIGNYVHGNEPAHHAAYLYNFTNQPWKTQEMVRLILKKQYHPGVDGLGGNDDCGQMSAWYILSAMGFYPVTPGSDQYQLGSPAIDKAVIKLENGRSFSIEAKDQSEQNIYVQKIVLNKKQLDRSYITHKEIMDGGTLIFYMGSIPLK